MSVLAGTGALIRLALRLDRVRLAVWVLALASLPAMTTAQYKTLYPDDATIRDVAGVLGNPALVAINGPLFRATLGGLTAWKIAATELVLVALLCIFTVVRHTRADEEAGRLELVRAGVVGRHAPLTAALITAGLASAAVGLLVTLGLAASGLAAAGSVAFGLAIGATGLVFAVIAAIAAQLTETARAATGIAAAVLGASYLLRAVGDTGPTWLSWVSPVGWAMRVRPYAGESWWVLGLAVALIAAGGAAAYALAARRDLGAGLLAQRPGPAQAPAPLRSPLALAWRLQRGILASWLAGAALCGATLGGAANGIGDAVIKNKAVTDLLTRMGGTKGLTEAYLAAVFGILGVTIAAYTVQATLRLRAEEAGGRLEPLLATGVTRLRWAAGHVLIAALGTAAVLAMSGVSAGVAYGLQTHDLSGQVPELLAAGLVQLPATLVLAGFGIALFGLAPRFASLAWAGLVACLVLLEVGTLLGLSQWIVDLSPFGHIPKLPGEALHVLPLVWLTGVAAALTATGLGAFRARDIG